MKTKWYKKASEDIPESCRGGDCYCSAGRYMMSNGINNPHLFLVHGEVTGQGKIKGIRYGHAWLEDGDSCIDVSQGKHLVLPKPFYYALGGINEDKIYKYNYEEMIEKTAETGRWGPWDLVSQN